MQQQLTETEYERFLSFFHPKKVIKWKALLVVAAVVDIALIKSLTFDHIDLWE
jgi:hypothetical protein